MGKGKGFIHEFEKFISRGNVMDMAVGVIIGGAFSSIITSLVDDILSPILGIFGGLNFDELSLNIMGDVTLKYGKFLTAVINFLIMALVIFCLVKAMNALSSKMVHNKEAAPAAPTTKICPFCKSEIPIGATKCAHCTSELTEDAGSVINEAAAAGEAGWFYESFVPGGEIVVSWGGGEDIVCGARFHSVECITLLSSTEPRKSAMDSKGIRRLYLLLRPKGRLSPGRKTPPGVSAPSTGLRLLIVLRII